MIEIVLGRYDPSFEIYCPDPGCRSLATTYVPVEGRGFCSTCGLRWIMPDPRRIVR